MWRGALYPHLLLEMRGFALLVPLGPTVDSLRQGEGDRRWGGKWAARLEGPLRLVLSAQPGNLSSASVTWNLLVIDAILDSGPAGRYATE